MRGAQRPQLNTDYTLVSPPASWPRAYPEKWRRKGRQGKGVMGDQRGKGLEGEVGGVRDRGRIEVVFSSPPTSALGVTVAARALELREQRRRQAERCAALGPMAHHRKPTAPLPPVKNIINDMLPKEGRTRKEWGEGEGGRWTRQPGAGTAEQATGKGWGGHERRGGDGRGARG